MAIYSIYDYYKINPDFGTSNDLKELVNTAHRYDMKVVLDFVTGYTIPGSVVYNKNWTIRIKLDELQKKAQKSGWGLEYSTYEGQPVVYYGCKWSKPRKCEVFGRIVGDEDEVILHHYPRVDWGPAIDRTNPELIEYLTKVAVYYVKKYDIDGFRLDAPQNNWNPKIISGDHSILELLKSIKKEIKSIKPSAVLISESPYLESLKAGEEIPDPVLDEVCEASYSYYFYANLIKGKIKTSKDLIETISNEKIWYNRTRIRFLETHDTERINKIASQLNKPYIVLISTIPGVPMIQAGEEIGVKNSYSENPIVNRNEEDCELNEFIEKIFQIRNKHNALKYGSISNVWKSGDDVIAYLREYKNEKVIVVINFLNKTALSTLNLSFLPKRTVLYDELSGETFIVNDPSNFRISVPAYGARILVLKPAPTEVPGKAKLSQVKVAILYQRVTDGIYYLNRSVDDVINILKETKTDFIFRGWWRKRPCPESSDTRSGFFPPEYIEESVRRGYTYEHLRNAIAKIKEEIPDVIFCGAVSCQWVNKKERDPITGETFDIDKTWAMALDPGKWNIPMSKEEFQERFAKRLKWIGPDEEYDHTKVWAYFPDITNPDFQRLILDLAKKQIDCGADAIWIDYLFNQARYLAKITKDPYHPAVKESLEAASKIVDEIHNYGHSKGKYIYVGSWASFVDFPYPPPDLDFVTPTLSSVEVYSMEIDENYWNVRIKKIREKLGDIPIFAHMDLGSERLPLTVFAQNLSTIEQREFLEYADDFFQKKGLIFIYPVHGGWFGKNPKILAFGKFNIYDSLAPEFDTYDTIKELAQNKIFKIRVETICDDRIDNDGDGLIDNEDGDCWIREGAILGEEYYVATKYSDYIKIIPELKNIGIKTIEMFPIWEHCNSPDPTKRWAVRDFNKLDPQRGTEEELRLFLKMAHKYNIKAITMLSEWASAFPSTPECRYFDSTGDGGALYRYQIENPDKNILIKDKSGNFVCHCCGYGYAPDPTSQDVINFFLEQYKKIQNYGFDGLRLDASAEFTCKRDEKINTCPYKLEEKPCPEPVEKDYPLQDYYRALSKLKKPREVWHAESASVKRVKIPVEKNPLCRFPFYYPDTTNDEYTEISSSHFNMILPYLFRGKINSVDFVKLLKKEPIAYNRARLRGVIKKDIGEVLTKESMNFVVNDPRYYPSVVLVSTIPGVPYVGLYELFGSRLADKLHGISGDSIATAPKRRAFWKKVLNIRNRSNALKYGTIENVWKSGDNIYAYLRKYKNEKVIVVINFLNKQATSILNLSFLSKATILHDKLNNETFIVDNPNNFKISVPAYGARILTIK